MTNYTLKLYERIVQCVKNHTLYVKKYKQLNYLQHIIQNIFDGLSVKNRLIKTKSNRVFQALNPINMKQYTLCLLLSLYINSEHIRN